MKVFFFIRPNPRNLDGMSYKVWKIEQKGRRVTVWWGPVKVVKRRILPLGRLNTKSWRFGTENAAKANEARRIGEQIAQGYERTPRRKT